MISNVRTAAMMLLAAAAVVMAGKRCDAHGGGLDSNGGHRDRKNGGYHIHRPSGSAPTGVYRGGAAINYSTGGLSSSVRSSARTSARSSVRNSARTQSPRQGDVTSEASLADGEKWSYKVRSTAQSGPRVILRVMLNANEPPPPSKPELQRITVEVDPGVQFHVFFFLPGMDISGTPWAVGSKLTSKSPQIRVFDERAPSRFAISTG